MSRPTFRRWVVIVVAVALLLRVAAVIVLAHQPTGLPDPTSYWVAGRSIAAGDGYRSVVGQLMAHYPPGYPYFLGAIFVVVGWLDAWANAATIVGLVQAVLGAATVLAVIAVGRVWAGRAVALVAGVLLAVWPSQVIYPAAILSETLYLFLFSWFLLAVVWACRTPGTGLRWITVAALLAGAAALVRPQGIVVSVPLLVVALLWGRLGWRRALGWGAVLVLGIVVVVAPWTYRNAQVYGAFVPISTNTWSNLCVGFEPRAAGHFSFAEDCVTGEFYSRGPASELRNEQILAQRVPGFLRTDPARLPWLSWQKLRYTFGIEVDAIDGVEVYGQSPVVSDQTRQTIYWVSAVFYFPLLVLAVIGFLLTIWRTARDRDHHLISAVLLAVALGAVIPPVLFFGDSRFKVPAAPMMVLFAAAVAVGSGRLVRDTMQRHRGDRSIQT